MINPKKKLEAEISEALIKFQRELIGKGPQEAKTYIVNDMLIARYKGVLTIEEKHLVSCDTGKKLVKEMRELLREMYSKDTERIVEEHTGCKVLSSHSDISTKTGERIEVFIMDRDLEKWLIAKNTFN
ncbi:hypothetical protein M670_00248 [Schinkia azotoformans MEV2011]|uniref:Na+-translocating membrane potential-generating system MpsC domain-containing protein n=1 Tax=Schinkia azotoformans MEV2011 TaxID=1348973 RepID=A0A072NTM3_SCHAZ|nr:DUF2294 domain-containing protein [Schinkia azotoformans]KEF40228.1 hypothetical protein M670_00248 [Schinkia azotoformans MEV2011]MEC1696462.1 DUF2294 domain-containing protein [Schinkia azotoformans]MEC1715151.1 DUF2294 domain-containing protein [Schinkia azotoformans]MEC1724133.1 DUF2294 domain-containing protein [Schinkia azotoformans]MEC1739799.1 DUF2294 domain-containing protein [Schinkia azotoformans]